MHKPKNGEYRSAVYTDRPDYADLPAPDKFQAIMGIIMTRLVQPPKAICSYSGGSDSYRAAYNKYKADRREAERKANDKQLSLFDLFAWEAEDDET